MKFKLQHTTSFRYAAPVADSVNDARLCPVSDVRQSCRAFELRIEPSTPTLLRRLDFYLNQVYHFEISQPHKELVVTAQSKVDTLPDVRNLFRPVPKASLDGLERTEQYYDFLHASERVPLEPIFLHEAREVCAAISDVRLCVEALMEYVFTSFRYDAVATEVDTPVAVVMRLRHGVCQDFAHVLTALCRSLRIPTRYVSGYFWVDPKDRPIGFTDHSASHAWVECYLPGIGWVGYDPTHNRLADERYIKVAIGRDYADVRPLAGTYRGAGSSEMTVSVQVERL